jgi:hypothetical protein
MQQDIWKRCQLTPTDNSIVSFPLVFACDGSQAMPLATTPSLKRIGGGVHLLTEQFCRLENNAEGIPEALAQKTSDCRKAFDEQYHLICKDFLPYDVSPAAATQ